MQPDHVDDRLKPDLLQEEEEGGWVTIFLSGMPRRS